MSSQNKIFSRTYQSPNDLETLKNFFTNARKIAGHDAGFLHAGDIMWRMSSNDDVNPECNVRFWEHLNLGVVGVGWLMLDEELEIHLHPHLTDVEVAKVANEILQWAETLTDEDILTSAPEDNTSLITAFEQAGYERDDYENFIYLLDLSQPIPEMKLPAGFTARHVLEGEFEKLVDIHREVWEPSEFTLEKYIQVRAMHEYIPEMDLVIATPDNTFAAYCIVWLEDGVGEFEPVGTRSAYRKQSFGKSIILEGCKRLKALGADIATVYSYPENRPFYEACGFKVVNKWLGFAKHHA